MLAFSLHQYLDRSYKNNSNNTPHSLLDLLENSSLFPFQPSLVCRGCAKRLPTHNAGVSIFRDTNLNSKDQNDVKAGIELITGVAVSDTDGLPRRLCAECNSKLEEFLAFRKQLLNSLRIFRSAEYPSAKSEVVVSSSSPQSTTRNNSSVTPAPELVVEETELRDEEMISVGCSESESCKGLDRINAESEDCESDIDVCSGEDDGVLELDVQSRKDVIYEIESSGESDIQVCDY